MLDNLLQQFAGGDAETMSGSELHGGVGQLAQNAEGGHVTGAVQDALGELGPQGFGDSVQQAAQNASPEERQGMANMLFGAVSQGGGSPDGVMSQLGISGQNLGPDELGQLATHAAENHPDALSSVLGDHLNTQGSGGGVMGMLGNPMVRQVGMQLAKKLL